jgi:hypothetical protein
MFFHLIPLTDLKKHSVTYWRPGRDHDSSADTWVVLAEVESGYFATVLDLPAEDDTRDRIAVTRGQAETMRSRRAEDALALFLRGRREHL